MSKVRIFLAGDSTVAAYPSTGYPQAGWGQFLGDFFQERVEVANHAVNGRSSKSFYDEGRLKAILDEIQKNDFLFIQFGHNDEKDHDPARYTQPYTTYQSYLMHYIEGARGKDAIPILVTPVNRRSYDENGTFIHSHSHYPDAMRQLACGTNTPLLDLCEKSEELFKKLGPEASKKLFLWLEPGQYENFPDGSKDNTHFSETGAKEITGLVIEGIKELKTALSDYIRKVK